MTDCIDAGPFFRMDLQGLPPGVFDLVVDGNQKADLFRSALAGVIAEMPVRNGGAAHRHFEVAVAFHIDLLNQHRVRVPAFARFAGDIAFDQQRPVGIHLQNQFAVLRNLRGFAPHHIDHAQFF